MPEAWKLVLLRKTRMSWLHFKQAHAEAKKIIMRANNKWWQKKASDVEEAFYHGNRLET